MSVKEKKEHKSKIRNIYVIAGKDSYMRSQCLAQIKKTISDERDTDIIKFDGKTVDIIAVLDELNMLAMFSSTKLVIVDDADKFISSSRGQLEEYFKNPSEDAILVLICESWRKNTKLAKLLEKTGELKTAEPMRGQSLIKWICNYAKQENKLISYQSAEELINIVGTDTGRLANELDKLITYIQERKQITSADIEILSGPTAQHSIFAINEKLADGNISDALKILDKIIANDPSAEYAMVGAMAFSLRRLLKARAMLEAKMPKQKILLACNIYPSIAQRFFDQLNRFDTKKIKKLIDFLTQTDYANKTGLGQGRTNMEKFIICSA